MKKIHVILILLITLIFIFSTCKEDLVTVIPPPPPVNGIPDSNIFDWKYIPVNGANIRDMYVADSNKVFFIGAPVMLYYNGENVSSIDYGSPQILAGTIDGYDVNNIFIGGVCQYPCRNSLLKKWNGSTFEQITMPEDSSQGIIDFVVKSSTDVWMSTEHRSIYHYNGINITSYCLPDSLNNIILLNDEYNNLYAFALKFIRVIYPVYHVYVLITYKLENNYFNEILRDTVNEQSSEMQRIVGISQNTIFRKGTASLYRFELEQWIKIPIPNGEFSVNEVDGLSNDDILCSGENSSYQHSYRIFYFNGIKWFRQSNIQYPLYSFVDKITKKFNRYYGFYGIDEFFKNYLFIASYKNNNMEGKMRRK